MTKIDFAKNAISFVVGAGASTIVAGVVKNNTIPANDIQKVTIPAAAFVIGMMAADATKMYTDHKIDELVTWWEKNIKKNA